MGLFIGGKYEIVNGDGKVNARIERFEKKTPEAKSYSRVVYVTRTGDRGPYRRQECNCSKAAFRKMADEAADLASVAS